MTINIPAKTGAFFKTMVIMGGSVALSGGGAAGCGGLTQADGSGGSIGTGAGAGTGSGGSGGSGAGNASGGTSSSGGQPLSSGGSGIIILPETGGSVGAGGAELGMGGAYPTDCPTEQLHCGTSYPDCTTGEFLVLPQGCTCDSERPASPDDCAADQVFVCQGATEDALGRPFDPMARFNCLCAASMEYGSCGDYCSLVGLGGWVSCNDPGEPEANLDAYLCGCAITVLK